MNINTVIHKNSGIIQNMAVPAYLFCKLDHIFSNKPKLPKKSWSLTKLRRSSTKRKKVKFCPQPEYIFYNEVQDYDAEYEEDPPDNK